MLQEMQAGVVAEAPRPTIRREPVPVPRHDTLLAECPDVCSHVSEELPM